MSNVDTQADPQPPGRADRSLVKAGRYRLDPMHTLVTWRVKHNGFSMVRGQFGAASGWLSFDPDQPDGVQGEVEFALNELTTPVSHFTAHLKSPDFFDVEHHPVARFVARAVHTDGDRARIDGELSLKGTTLPVSLDATFIGAGEDPASGALTFGFEATASIGRTAFGLGMGAPFVGDEVGLTMDAVFVAASAAPAG